MLGHGLLHIHLEICNGTMCLLSRCLITGMSANLDSVHVEVAIVGCPLCGAVVGVGVGVLGVLVLDDHTRLHIWLLKLHFTFPMSGFAAVRGNL